MDVELSTPPAKEIRRLFVPLAGAPFRWFAEGLKTWEVRRVGGQFRPELLVPGRRVELRRGYSTPDRLYGIVGRHAVADTLAALFETMPWRAALPEAKNVGIFTANSIIDARIV